MVIKDRALYQGFTEDLQTIFRTGARDLNKVDLTNLIEEILNIHLVHEGRERLGEEFLTSLVQDFKGPLSGYDFLSNRCQGIVGGINIVEG